MTTEEMINQIKQLEPKLTKGLTDAQLTDLVDEATLFVDGYTSAPEKIKDVLIRLYTLHLISLGVDDDISNMKVGQITIQHDTNSKSYDRFLDRFNDLINQYAMNGEVIFDEGGEYIDRHNAGLRQYSETDWGNDYY